jgi:deoxyribodipyrimidine photo-lyase
MTTVFWFRRDLRLHDNTALLHALQSGAAVLPIFIFDPNILNDLKNKKDRRVDFIHQSLQGLHDELQKHGSSLLVLHDTPENAFKKITEAQKISAVYCNHDYEPYAVLRDAAIAKYFSKQQIDFHTFKDQVIFEKNEIVKSDGKPYTIFTPYSKIWKNTFTEQHSATQHSEKEMAHFIKTKPFDFPSLPDLGFEKSDVQFTPPVFDIEVIGNYHNTRNTPSVRGTSQLSTHLRFGSISVRQAVKIAVQQNEQWLNELIWREFFMMILFHFPKVVAQSFKEKYDKIQWRNNEREFQLWCKGETGYPIVDAGMRELNATGLMHNRVRMIVASFLTKHLLIDWRWGEAYFAEKLLDYELSSNNGNWQWAAGCGCDSAPYFRIFNPEEQTKKFDKENRYINTWIKEKKDDYPQPIVEHKFARERVLRVFKEALKE